MANAEKVSVTMTPEMMQAIREAVDSGEFASTSEAMRDAVRAWRRERLEFAERLEAVRARVQRSLGDPRPSVPADDAEGAMARFMKAEQDAAKRAAR